MKHHLLCLFALFAFVACKSTSPDNKNENTETVSQLDDAGMVKTVDDLLVPDGFAATVVAEGVGNARHIAVASDGRIFVKLRKENNGGAIVTLFDTDGDHVADQTEYWGGHPGTGMEIFDGYIYHSSDSEIYRVPTPADGQLVSDEESELILTMPGQNSHEAKPLSFDDAGNMYVNIGAPANACQEQRRTKGSPGQRPCPLLELHGGIWRYSPDERNQEHTEANRYASGLRQVVAMAWHPVFNALYAVQHGRDQLNTLWPEHFNDKQNAELPAEEFRRIEEGATYAWPYCYYDGDADQYFLSPEYGGDGEMVGECDQYAKPLSTFPAHMAPNDLIFYTGDMFPARYINGAFVALHGSWNRAPLPQKGYLVAFIPMAEGVPSGDWEIFADQFANPDGGIINSPSQARYRPMGLAQGLDGSLYVTDSKEGRVWRIAYNGKGG